MEVYIEFFVLDNMIITSLLLWLSSKILKLKTSGWQIFFAATFATILAGVLPMLELPFYVGLIAKLISGLMCVIICLKTTTFKYIAKFFLLFLGLTFALGGIIYAAFEVFGQSVDALNLANNNFGFPISIFLITTFMFVLFCIKVAKIINKHKKASGYLYSTELTIGAKTIATNAYLDSGNRLIDKQSGKPVNILSFTLIQKFCGNRVLLAIAENRLGDINLPNARFTQFNTVGSQKNQMLVFDANNLTILHGNKKTMVKNAACGVVLKKFNDVCQYEILLNSEVI